MTSNLITRLSKLDAPGREADARIWCEVNGFRYCDHFPLDRETQVFFKEKGKRTGKVSGDSFPHAPTYTASVDAAIALAERVLPNERVWINRIAFDSNHQWRASLTGNHVSWGVNPAIALCIALLRAKEVNHAE